MLSVALACKKRAESKLSPAAAAQAEKLKPEVKLRLTQLSSLAAKSKSLPQTSTDEPPTKAVAPGIISENQLDDPHKTLSSDELDVGDSTFSVCKSKLESTALKDEDIQWLERCSKLTTAGVIRQKSFVRPEVDASTRSFKPGEFRGDIVVFDLATAEVRARYSLDVQNDSQLRLEGNPDQRAWERLAESELKRKVTSVIQAKLLEGNKRVMGL